MAREAVEGQQEAVAAMPLSFQLMPVQVHCILWQVLLAAELTCQRGWWGDATAGHACSAAQTAS